MFYAELLITEGGDIVLLGSLYKIPLNHILEINLEDYYLQVERNLHEEGSVGVGFHLDDEVLSLAVSVAALPDPARRVDLPEAAQADAAPDAPLNAPGKIFSDARQKCQLLEGATNKIHIPSYEYHIAIVNQATGMVSNPGDWNQSQLP